jgi:SAM-dependent methyltransferase
MPRDTDADWRRLAESDPYFAVLTDERFHVGQIRDKQIEEFYASGVYDVATALRRIRSRAPDFSPRRCLDFGCGVGRLSLALAAHAVETVGLDVAPAMLSKARNAAKVRGVSNVRFIDTLGPKDRFDWINSYLVFQHIPPQRGYAILADLFTRLESRGFCSMHFPLFRSGEVAGNSIHVGSHWFCDDQSVRLLVENDNDPTGIMRMFDYNLNRILALMVANSVEPYGLHTLEHGGYHSAWIFGQRA